MITVSTLEAKFKRSNLSSQNTLWGSDLTYYAQLEGIRKMLQPLECLILFYYNSTDLFWVITNKRLIIQNDRSLSTYFLQDLEKVNLGEIAESTKAKNNCNYITFIVHKEVKILPVESKSWYIVYEILKLIVSNKGIISC